VWQTSGNTGHTASGVKLAGDIRVKDDSIIVTYYKDHEVLGLREKYRNISQQLENGNISPIIPWLYDYKL